MAKRRSYRTGSIFQRGEKWHIQYFHKGKRVREPADSKVKQDAVDLLRKRLGEISVGKFRGLTPGRVTVGDLVRLVVEDYKFNDKRSVDEVEWRAEKNILPELGKTLASKLTADRVRKFVAFRRGEGAAAATINRELSIIRRGFKLAAHHEPPLVTAEPFIAKLDEDNARQGFLEDHEYQALRDALPEHLKTLLVVGYHVGNRAGELRKLQWSQVDLEARQFNLTSGQTKGKKPRTLPIYGDMIDCLAKQKAKRDEWFPECPWVFHWNGKPIGSHMKGWRKACAAAAVPGLLFHDLRRSAIRNMVRSGMSEKMAMEFSGHRTAAVFRRYDIVSKADLDTAAEKLTAYLEEKRAPRKKAPGSESSKVTEIKRAK